jgi:spore coat polysaccharide biosynthesis protein SpsF
MERTGIILQARMGSTRLPGKVLARIGRRSVLEHCVRRLERSGYPVVVATTDRGEDDIVDRTARELGAGVYRGAVDDVLRRFIDAATAFGFTEVIRATADNPFVDMGAAPRASTARLRASADHAIECGLPIGAAVEAVSLDALTRAHELASDPYDREHVTSLIRRDPRFRALRAVAPGLMRRGGLRLTVDTPEDLAVAREIHAELGGGDDLVELPEVIQAAETVLIRGFALRGATKKGA